jgi:hypothetical protein
MEYDDEINNYIYEIKNFKLNDYFMMKLCKRKEEFGLSSKEAVLGWKILNI